MNAVDIGRLKIIEKRCREIAEENGLKTTDIIFEIVSSQRVLEGMSYMFPVNFSHWSFGRDYERYRTIYERSGGGIPYEQVWNTDPPKAFLVETNPFALNALVVAHVFGHVDFFLANRYLKHCRSFSNVAEEARNAAHRFKDYAVKYGTHEVEQTIDAGMSIWWQQHPDPMIEEELDNEASRERLLSYERAKLEKVKTVDSEFKSPLTEEEIELVEGRLRRLGAYNPPRPIYDLLGYIIRYSPKPLKPYQQDILTVLRNQVKALAPGSRTKMLNEGWATYWHVRMMRQLFKEGLITTDEHGVFNAYHSAVTRESYEQYNWYRIGLKFFEYVEDAWNKGRFGKDYEECLDPYKKSIWDTKINQGKVKILEVREFYSDRMAIEELFTDEFIRFIELYIYRERIDRDNDQIVHIIEEDDPHFIRIILKRMFALYGAQFIKIINSNFNGRHELLLEHDFEDGELDMDHVKGVLRNIYYLWGEKVCLTTRVKTKESLCSWNGKEFKIASP